MPTTAFVSVVFYFTFLVLSEQNYMIDLINNSPVFERRGEVVHWAGLQNRQYTLEREVRGSNKTKSKFSNVKCFLQQQNLFSSKFRKLAVLYNFLSDNRQHFLLDVSVCS